MFFFDTSCIFISFHSYFHSYPEKQKMFTNTTHAHKYIEVDRVQLYFML